MLELDRLNGEKIWINPDQIKMVFKSPDTTLVFMDDSRMTVKNSVEDLNEQWMRMRRQITLKETVK
jgi:uncharacterized protein YlzI (FlbEa/FlbD family)